MIRFSCTFFILLIAFGCNSRNGAGALKLQHIQLSDLGNPKLDAAPISLSAAKNEWTDFTVQLTGLPAGKVPYSLRLRPLRIGSTNEWTVDSANFSAFQILFVPPDLNRAA